MTNYKELDAVIDVMAAHDVKVRTFDVPINPEQAVPDTLLYVVVPGERLARGDSVEYTHAIHRYTVIGGEDITWVGPGQLGSTTRGAFGSDPADDDTIDATWDEILRRLSITDDPHAR